MASGRINLQANDGKVAGIVFEDGASGNVAVTVPKDGGKLAADSSVVHKTGDETIAGVKTFSSNVVMNGNVGIGVAPSVWSVGKTLEIGYLGNGLWCDQANEIFMTSNAYYNSGFKYGNDGYATQYKHFNGWHTWRTAPSGTAGNAITWTNTMSLDNVGNLLLTSGTGGLGYGTGSGGTVTQITSKLTAIALGKPSGRIITHNSSLSANSSALFQMINPCVGDNDTISWSFSNAGASTSVDYTKYDLTITVSSGGNVFFVLRNLSGGALSDVITIDFTLNRGAIS